MRWIRSLNVSKSSASALMVTKAEFTSGHFPGKPIIPAVMQLQALEELGRAFCGQMRPSGAKGTYALGAVLNARFRSPLTPDTTASLKVTLHSQEGSDFLISGLVETTPEPGQKIAEALLRFTLTPNRD
ncbi:hypothetical protein NDN08_003971 [Rhodosorus marinus]|uniref:ApeI dehydratase-like domain-containing protein n=1 Tax=Rhodosorus marinus TaxID=101924 RepID=A0AAV8UGZ0_9RHOD|nr:hypothetical protein NDN08_003971 [Rhodosorus marinus]